MLFVNPVLNYLWTANTKSRFVRSIRRIIGVVDSDTVRHPMLLNACFTIEMFLSIWFAMQWVLRSYSHAVTPLARIVDRILCTFFLVTYMINAMRNSFAVTYTLQPTALITLFTVVPTFIRPLDDGAQWFSFSYLRIANAVHAYEKLEKTGALRDVSEMKRGYLVTLLRTLVLVVILAGTTFSLEVLGDPGFFRDSHVTTAMGEISFLQMVYWIFTTISTVGYGDFAPTTTLSRLFIIMAIVVGVYFFSTEVGYLVELHKMQSSGQGKWKPYKGNSHVIVIGGGVRGSSSVLKSFLDEIFSSKHNNKNGLEWPNLSFMASTEIPKELRETIARLPRHARCRTKYFMGDPTRHSDMERLRMGEADVVIIMADLSAADIDQEDTNNILRALAVKQSYPHVHSRLMLQRPASKVNAVRAGIWPSRCFSINELKSALFALSCPIRGWSTMVAHCLISEEDRDSGDEGDDETCMDQGRNSNLTGFCVAAEYAGLDFLEFCRQVAVDGCMPLAVQIQGVLTLNPTFHILEVGDIIFGFFRDLQTLRTISDQRANWRTAFLANQKTACNATGTSSDVNQRLSNKAGGGARATLARKNWFRKDPQRMSTTLMTDSDPSNPKTKTTEVPKTPPASIIPSTKEPTGPATTIPELGRNAENIAEEGGHYILVVLAGNPWQQMQALLQTLRGEHLPVFVPIIILSSQMPSDWVLSTIFGDKPKLGLLQTGRIAGISDLIKAGMMKARCIMLYAGNAAEAASADRRMIDGVGVTMLAAIEGALCDSKTQNKHLVLELHRQESVKFMHRFPLYEERYTNHDHAWAFNPDECFTNHPRFASGNIFTASCLGALVARSFYSPGICELLESIVLNNTEFGNHASSYPWQISLPEGFLDRTYGDLVQYFLQPGTGALCLGLYRRCFPGSGSNAGYVVTHPSPSAQLWDGDLVTVLAPAEFAQEYYAQGKIPGVCDMTSSASEVVDTSGCKVGYAPLLQDTNVLPVFDGSKLPPPMAVPSAGTDVGNRNFYVNNADSGAGGCDVGIASEVAVANLEDLRQELILVRADLRESIAREAALRSAIRACSFPLPSNLETPRTGVGGSIARRRAPFSSSPHYSSLYSATCASNREPVVDCVVKMP